jgi:hypothetical protein
MLRCGSWLCHSSCADLLAVKAAQAALSMEVKKHCKLSTTLEREPVGHTVLRISARQQTRIAAI